MLRRLLWFGAFFSFSAVAAHFGAQVSVQKGKMTRRHRRSFYSVEEPPLQTKFAFSLGWLFQTSKTSIDAMMQLLFTVVLER